MHRKEKALSEISQAERWEQLWQEAELLQAHLALIERGMTEVSVTDWWGGQGARRTLFLDPSKTPQEELQERFRTAKKRRKALEHLPRYLDRLQEQFAQIDRFLEKLKECETEEEFLALQPRLQAREKSSRQEEAVSQPYRLFYGSRGEEILVGKSARDNEALTFRVAHGNDWWFHVSGMAGSHVVLRLQKGQELCQEALLDAGLLALHYSKAKSQGASDISYTQAKWVRRLPGGRPGQVLLAQRSSFFIRWDPARWEKIQKQTRS